MARGELHVQLNVNYADDEKLAFVSRDARLLYVDALCLAKRLLNDGVLTVLQVEKLMYPARPTAARKAADELVQSGAWACTTDAQGHVQSYTISAWLKRNKSREQIAKEREAAEEAAALGNHRRWHEARGESDPRCRFCSDPRSGTRSPSRSGGGQRGVSPETETETETETEKNNISSSPATPATDADTPAAPKPVVGTDNDPDFVRFWATYPKRVGKGQARKAWAKVIKAKADPEAIIAAAQRYAREREREDPKFTAYPATWLNGERWDDQPATTPATSNTDAWWEN